MVPGEGVGFLNRNGLNPFRASPSPSRLSCDGFVGTNSSNAQALYVPPYVTWQPCNQQFHEKDGRDSRFVLNVWVP